MKKSEILILLALFLIGCKEEKSPRARLAEAAFRNGYLASGNKIEVPPAIFSFEKLQYWKNISEEKMKIRTDGSIARISASFDCAGYKIYQVEIIWMGSEKEVSFPYPLDKEKTAEFVKRAAKEMSNKVQTI